MTPTPSRRLQFQSFLGRNPQQLIRSVENWCREAKTVVVHETHFYASIGPLMTGASGNIPETTHIAIITYEEKEHHK